MKRSVSLGTSMRSTRLRNKKLYWGGLFHREERRPAERPMRKRCLGGVLGFEGF